MITISNVIQCLFNPVGPPYPATAPASLTVEMGVSICAITTKIGMALKKFLLHPPLTNLARSNSGWPIVFVLPWLFHFKELQNHYQLLIL